METQERFGRYVLQSEEARATVGSLFRAVQLGESGYERHVQLFRSERLSPEVAESLAEGLRKGGAVQHAQVARVFEAGRIDRCAFLATELFEGRTVRAIMDRSQAERHPFAPDHALLIASKAAAALEAAQAKKTIHGFLLPEFIHVSHDGEVSVSGFGLSARALRQANCVGVREALVLAPEVEGSGILDIRADLFSLGAQLFEMLTGAPLPRHQPTRASIEAVRIQTPGGDGTPLPKALAALLVQALAEEPERRYKDAASFKKAVDTLLFSGDYSPTTFNLAFFMHTLFRDEGDEDAARIKAEKTADYRPYLASASVAPTPRAPTTPSSVLSPSGLSHPALAGPPPRPADPGSGQLKPEITRSDAARHDSGRTPRPTPPLRPAADDQLFQSVTEEKKSFPLAPVALVVVAVLAGAGYLATRSGSPTATPAAAAPTMNPAEVAALARVRELESRLAALEAEKTAAEQLAAEEAKKVVEAQARARGRAVDPAELLKAQEEARRKSQIEQEERLQAERRQIEEERRLAEEARAAEAARAATPPPTPTPLITPSPLATPTPAPTVQATPTPPPSTPAPPAEPTGPALLDVADPAVTAPQLISQDRLDYPPIARRQRITGIVIISALIDEQGKVAEVRLIRGVSSNAGLNEAAMESVKKRKYKPATLNGKPGRAWIAIQVDFRL